MRTLDPISWTLDRWEDLYAEVDGLRVRYWDVGSGPPVLLVHGLGASVETWLPNVESLAAEHRVLAVDLPGFGRSVKDGFPAGIGFTAHFVARFLETVGAERTSLVGNSAGGLVTLKAALVYPEIVDRLVLVCSGGLGREVALSLRLLGMPYLGEYLIKRADPASYVRGTVATCLADATIVPPELMARWIELASLPGAMTSLLRAARTGISPFGQRPEIVLLGQLRDLRASTLIVWGRDDPIIPVAHAHTANRMIPGSRLEVFENSRHCPQLDQASRFNELVREFLGGEV